MLEFLCKNKRFVRTPFISISPRRAPFLYLFIYIVCYRPRPIYNCLITTFTLYVSNAVFKPLIFDCYNLCCAIRDFVSLLYASPTPFVSEKRAFESIAEKRTSDQNKRLLQSIEFSPFRNGAKNKNQ